VRRPRDQWIGPFGADGQAARGECLIGPDPRFSATQPRAGLRSARRGRRTMAPSYDSAGRPHSWVEVLVVREIESETTALPTVLVFLLIGIVSAIGSHPPLGCADPAPPSFTDAAPAAVALEVRWRHRNSPRLHRSSHAGDRVAEGRANPPKVSVPRTNHDEHGPPPRRSPGAEGSAASPARRTCSPTTTDVSSSPGCRWVRRLDDCGLTGRTMRSVCWLAAARVSAPNQSEDAASSSGSRCTAHHRPDVL
jgi:hypothetical protein